MARSWLVDGRAIAKKVKSASASSAFQIKDYGANRECPKCHFRIDNSDGGPPCNTELNDESQNVVLEWPGLPAGVKFEPSDSELVEHLAAKCGEGNLKSHMFIDEFIPTLEDEKGICCTHPENLPGAQKDGTSIHFFHRTFNAYSTGQRKRRKIHGQSTLVEEHVRWHKTGKTKPVMDNGVSIGWKKIMVLYKSAKKRVKPEKTNWVMYQYHLGSDEEEKDGDYVVSKIYYQQPKNTDQNVKSLMEEPEGGMHTSPSTPAPSLPNPPRSGVYAASNDAPEDAITRLVKVSKFEAEALDGHPPTVHSADDNRTEQWLAGESQAFEDQDLDCLDNFLLCQENMDSAASLNNIRENHNSSTGFTRNTNDFGRDDNASLSIAELENLEFDTPPDFALADLQFGSQDSFLNWLDHL